MVYGIITLLNSNIFITGVIYRVVSKVLYKYKHIICVFVVNL